jgi:hypothetical protein
LLQIVRIDVPLMSKRRDGFGRQRHQVEAHVRRGVRELPEHTPERVQPVDLIVAVAGE